MKCSCGHRTERHIWVRVGVLNRMGVGPIWNAEPGVFYAPELICGVRRCLQGCDGSAMPRELREFFDAIRERRRVAA